MTNSVYGEMYTGELLETYSTTFLKPFYSKNRHISLKLHPNVTILKSNRENSTVKLSAKFHLDILIGSIFSKITGRKISFCKFLIT